MVGKDSNTESIGGHINFEMLEDQNNSEQLKLDHRIVSFSFSEQR